MRLLVFSFLLLLLAQRSEAQSKYWVFLSEKEKRPAVYLENFDVKAIDRRIKNHVPLDHPRDWPISSKRVNEVSKHVQEVRVLSRWLNAISVIASEDQIEALKNLDFVLEVRPFMQKCDLAEVPFEHGMSFTNDIAEAQTKIMGSEELDKKNLHGKGVRIAVLDAGFRGIHEIEGFQHLRNDGQIIKTWDFIRQREKVDLGSTHGTGVLSCIAGCWAGLPLGLATEAEFLLARTEHNFREPASEEDYWVAAAEWADQNGADVINSSLGYTKERYFWADMDGRTAPVSQGANQAAAVGIIVVNSMGNDGDSSWKTLGAPADADSVISVGGIAPFTGLSIGFSSFGPNAVGVQKPNVTAFGRAVTLGPKGVDESFGTSFSSPLVAGFVACLIQEHPEWTWQQTWDAIHDHGSLFPYSDYSHGFGIPTYLHRESKSFKIIEEQQVVLVELNEPYKAATSEIQWRKTWSLLPNYVFYKIMNNEGQIDYYGVIEPEGTQGMRLNKSRIPEGGWLELFYEGHYEVYHP